MGSDKFLCAPTSRLESQPRLPEPREFFSSGQDRFVLIGKLLRGLARRCATLEEAPDTNTRPVEEDWDEDKGYDGRPVFW